VAITTLGCDARHIVRTVEIGGALAVRVTDSADDEGDAGLVESAEGVVEVDWDADGDAGCQPQDPALPAAAGKEPGIAGGDDGLPVDVGEFGAPSVIEVTVLTKESKSSRCSHPEPMTSSQAASRE